MPDYPVRDALGNVIVEHAYDVAWDKPDPYDYSGDYPVLDGQGGVIIQHPFDPALPGTNPITGTGPVLGPADGRRHAVQRRDMGQLPPRWRDR